MTLTTDQRRAIWERDGGVCGICGEPVPWEKTDIDHVQPRALRGPTTPDNLRPTHWKCNRSRGSREGLQRHPDRVITGHPGMERTSLWLDEESARALDALARRLGVNRSGTVRYALRRVAQQEGIESDVPLLEGLERKRGPKKKLAPPAAPRPTETN